MTRPEALDGVVSIVDAPDGSSTDGSDLSARLMNGWLLQGLASSCEVVGETRSSPSTLVSVTYELDIMCPRCFVVDVTLLLDEEAKRHWTIEALCFHRSLVSAGDDNFTQLFCDPADTQTAPKQVSAESPSIRRIQLNAAARRIRFSLLRVDSAADPPREYGKTIDVGGYTPLVNPGPEKLIELANLLSNLRICPWATPLDITLASQLVGYAMYNLRKYTQAAEYFHQAAEQVLTAALAPTAAKIGIDEEEIRTWVIELELLAAHAPTQYEDNARKQSTVTIAALQRVARLCACDNAASALECVADLRVIHRSLRSCILDLDPALLVAILQSMVSPLRAKLAAAAYLEQLVDLASGRLGPQLIAIGCVALDLIYTHQGDKDPLVNFLANSFDEVLERIVDSVCATLPHLSSPVLQEGLVDHLYRLLGDSSTANPANPCRPKAHLLRMIAQTVNLIPTDATIPSGVMRRVFYLVQDADSIVLRRAAFHAWDSLSFSLLVQAKISTIQQFQAHFSLFCDLLSRIMYTTSRDLTEKHLQSLQRAVSIGPSSFDMNVYERRVAVASPTALSRLLILLRDCVANLGCENSNDGDENLLPQLKGRMRSMVTKLSLSVLIDVSTLGGEVEFTAAFPEKAPPDEANVELVDSYVASTLEHLDLVCETLHSFESTPFVLDREAGLQLLNCVLTRLGQYSPTNHLLCLSLIWIPSSEVPSSLALQLLRSLLPWARRTESEAMFRVLVALLDVCHNVLLADDIACILDVMLDQEDEIIALGVVETVLTKMCEVVTNSLPQREQYAESLRAGCSGMLQSVAENILYPSFYLAVIIELAMTKTHSIEEHDSRHSAYRKSTDTTVDVLNFGSRSLAAASRERKWSSSALAFCLSDPVFEFVVLLQKHEDCRVVTASFEFLQKFLDVLLCSCGKPGQGLDELGDTLDLRSAPSEISGTAEKAWKLLSLFSLRCIHNQNVSPDLHWAFLGYLKEIMYASLRKENIGFLRALSFAELNVIWDSVMSTNESYSRQTLVLGEHCLCVLVLVAHGVASLPTNDARVHAENLEELEEFARLRIVVTVERKLASSFGNVRLHGMQLFKCWLLNRASVGGCARCCNKLRYPTIWSLLERAARNNSSEGSATLANELLDQQRKSQESFNGLHIWLPELSPTPPPTRATHQETDLELFLRTSVSYENELGTLDRGQSVPRRQLGSGDIIDLCDRAAMNNEPATPIKRDAVEDDLLAGLAGPVSD